MLIEKRNVNLSEQDWEPAYSITVDDEATGHSVEWLKNQMADGKVHQVCFDGPGVWLHTFMSLEDLDGENLKIPMQTQKEHQD